MSWFDASGFANLAKSALKEAQKTIDKALDIKEEDQQQQKVAESPVIDDSNFFAAWGIKNESSVPAIQQTSSLKQDSSIWGSFTGSFFEPPKTSDKSKSSRSLREVSDQSLDTCLVTSSVSLPDNLASVQNKSPSSSQSIDLDAESTEDDTDKTAQKKDSKDFSTSDSASKTASDSEIESPKSSGEKLIYSRHLVNRVSLLSSESDKKSSESVEILGSRSATNTDCTTTPDSEIVSATDSPSLSRSTLDLQRNSESVEILPDSLVTSPSSVEILEDPSKTESPFLSPMGYNKSPDAATTFFEPESESLKNSSSDISPYASPMEESKSLRLEDTENTEELTPISQLQSFSVGSLEKSNLFALETCQTIDESDEISQAEDSYTSASESTMMTIMENFQQQLDQSKRLHDSSESAKSTCITSASSQLESSQLDSLKDVKQSLYLSLEPITTQPIRKVESLAEKIDIDLVKTIEPLSSEADKLKSQLLQEFGAPDQLGLTDSSCEGTLVDTSSDENSTVKTNKEVNSEEEGSLTSSSYVKNMLADAMVEKNEILADLERHDISHREHSPISSESRSDLVKIGSDQASGHTSGDELETTTSSDIEIISRYSPNGDSSSTQSRQSPANLHSCKSGDLLTKTLKTRGHSRELSEISIGSDDGINEIDKLRKRIQELVEILEVRESKLIDVSRMNMDLHEQNNHLKLQVDNWEKRAQQNQDVNLIADEYTQRMSVLEKKFQQTIRERDLLKDQVESLKKELSDQSSSLNAEKDEIIKQLREEGEKLSKQQLQHSNIIKKLRAKEKETEATLKSQKEQLEEQSSELDRLKRSLNAKEEVERSQIEAVHTLTAKVKKQEKEILSLQEKLDNTTHKMNAYKTSLDAAKVELAETKLNFNAAEEELKQVFESAGESCRLSAQVQDLKVKLRQEEESHVKKIEGLKQENNDLLKRLEAAEARSEELSESVSLATKPLLRQLEQLQSNLTYKSNSFMKQEKILSDTIDELQTKLDSMVATDRSHVEENINLKSRIALLESQIKRAEAERLKLEELCEETKLENKKLVGDVEKLMMKIKNIEKSHAEEVKDFKREIESLKDKLFMEKAASDAEKRKTSNVLEHQQSTGEESRVSPTSSVRRDSISSTNSVWLAFNDSIFDTSSGRFPNVYDGLRTSTNTTSTIETLQAQLKAREGEIQTLQWEMSRKNNERDALNMELSNLSMKVEELSAKLVQVEALNANLSEIQTRYDALLQMYGEKVEETQELQLDLEDVKEMYKSQIDQLLRKES
ncbi:GSCOCG00000268001-RA-CDS [Cotesia congregata]|uniref:Similar to TMF1: TATA element modulatory factor (Homo sapiens) n=1 Tax=Cotesia congregata TaxID=51543 RepID=A0A8J2MQ73_COTCN|nr:GSCOCG00000268001-RA-CDS [Cotesia congregata]CAG5101197.1 Similar to TMF1: TATA element modulatory factor (Homo sapiens) [Cotesia congregata]